MSRSDDLTLVCEFMCEHFTQIRLPTPVLGKSLSHRRQVRILSGFGLVDGMCLLLFILSGRLRIRDDLVE